MPIGIETAAINLATAVACGSLIGFERQFRQRKAGLRTHALVALGAAAFMIFSMLVEGDMSPSRVAAQVVSGIGFLGAGIIFRDGLNVHGLTTAATLWCSAAVGLLAGAGHWEFALTTTGMVVFVNIGLRPLVQWMKRRVAGKATGRVWQLSVTIPEPQEAHARGLILRTLTVGGLHMSQLDCRPHPEGLGMMLTATVTAEGASDPELEHAAQRLAIEPGFTSVAWCVAEDG